MNNINQYVEEEFKVEFKRKIKKSLSLSFEKILSNTLELNNINESEIDNKQSLHEWFNYCFNLDYLLKVPDLDLCNEIIIHNSNNIDMIQNGNRSKLKVEFLEEQDLQISYEVLARKHNVEWNFQNPFASFKITIGKYDFRCTLIHKDITENNQSKAFFRASNIQELKLQDFGIKEEHVRLLKDLVVSKKNIIVSGATASGKTSLLKSLISEFKAEEHIVVIEDTHELPGPNNSFTHFISKGSSKKTMTDYCEYALRISPDRILLGEIRSREVIPFIMAMNTGHRGLMTTVHANSAQDTLTRLATLFSLFSQASNAINFNQVLKMICQNIDYVIFLEDKGIKEIIEVIGSECDKPIYKRINLGMTEQREIPQGSFENVV